MINGELSILKILENFRTPVLNRVFEYITMLGEETLVVFLIVALWFAYDKIFAQKVFFVTVASLGVNGIIKNLVKLPRPFASGEVSCVRPDTATGYSFPSGHTQNFATWSTVLARNIKRHYIEFFVGVLILFVAFSRMFLGAHYISDVVVGALFGVGIAVAGDVVFEKVDNKYILYGIAIAVMTPFAVLFMFNADPFFEDFYKVYGMIAGLPFAIFIEEKFAPIRYNEKLWKKTLRVITGVLIAYVVKESLGLITVSDSIVITFISYAVKYFILVFAVFGICPVIFKMCRF